MHLCCNTTHAYTHIITCMNNCFPCMYVEQSIVNASIGVTHSAWSNIIRHFQWNSNLHPAPDILFNFQCQNEPTNYQISKLTSNHFFLHLFTGIVIKTFRLWLKSFRLFNFPTWAFHVFNSRKPSNKMSNDNFTMCQFVLVFFC